MGNSSWTWRMARNNSLCFEFSLTNNLLPTSCSYGGLLSPFKLCMLKWCMYVCMYVYVCSNVCMLKCMLTRNSLTVFFSRKSWIPPLPSLKWWFLYNRFGHPGISATLASVCRFYWFPKSSALIREIVLNCSIYLSFKSQSDKRLVGNPLDLGITHPWEMIFIHHCTVGHRSSLIPLFCNVSRYWCFF